MLSQSDEQRQLFESEAVRIVQAANAQGLTLRILGSLAFHLHCPRYGHLQKTLGRAYTDIDYAGYRSQASRITQLFASSGYQEDAELNILYAGQRMIFNHRTNGLHIDVFLDRLNFCHEVSWENRLQVDPLTLPLAEMLLEKMQIVKINEKDIIDTIMIMLEHPLGDADQETIHIGRVSQLCAQDWGLWRTVTMNLEKVQQLCELYEQLGAPEKGLVHAQVQRALARIQAEPKPLSWKLRAKIGDRVRWYQEVDEV
jgi:hypothetical protein